MNVHRRAVRAVSGIAVAGMMVLSGCGGSSDNNGGGGATTGGASSAPTAPPQPPATTPQAAVAIVQQWAAAKGAADVNLVIPKLTPIEEGPALEMDTAQYLEYGEFLKKIPASTASDITAVVPQDGAYPTSFLAQATFHSGGAAYKYLLVFAKDDAGSPWKVAAYLGPVTGGFPTFAVNAQGYGTALDTATMPGYPAPVPGVAGAYCNLLGTIFGGAKQVPNAPSLSFAPGQYTSAYVNAGKTSTDTIRHGGGTSEGSDAPETYAWAYKLADGSAFDIVTVQSTLDQSAGPNTQLSVPDIFPFVTAGRYSTTTQASTGTFGMVEPASGTTVSVTMAYTEFTKAQAS